MKSVVIKSNKTDDSKAEPSVSLKTPFDSMMDGISSYQPKLFHPAFDPREPREYSKSGKKEQPESNSWCIIL